MVAHIQRTKSLRLKASSLQQYGVGVRCIERFASTMGLDGLPMTTPGLLLFMDWAVSPNGGNLSAVTLKGYLNSVSQWYNHVMHIVNSNLGGHLENPVLTASVRGFRSVLIKWFTKPSTAKRPFTWAEVTGILLRGFDEGTPFGLFAKLFFCLCTFGMLRQTAAANLRVSYTIHSTPLGPVVEFLEDSEVRIVYDPEDQAEVIRLCHSLDKNLSTARTAVSNLPGYIPGFKLDLTALLRHYLISVHPPSLHEGTLPPRDPKWGRGYLALGPQEQDGLLFAYPKFTPLRGPPVLGTRQLTFSRMPFTGGADLFKHAFARAFPEKASKTILRLLGSHSGRKTLALWLWVQQRDKRLLQDAAHWSVAMEGAIASYYATPWRTIVHAVMALEDMGSLHIFPELI